jgi:hypothetical protein
MYNRRPLWQLNGVPLALGLNHAMARCDLASTCHLVFCLSCLLWITKVPRHSHSYFALVDPNIRPGGHMLRACLYDSYLKTCSPDRSPRSSQAPSRKSSLVPPAWDMIAQYDRTELSIVFKVCKYCTYNYSAFTAWCISWTLAHISVDGRSVRRPDKAIGDTTHNICAFAT